MIDEGSMIGDDMLEYIIKFTEMFNVYLIVLGDDEQLPPVTKKKCKVCDVLLSSCYYERCPTHREEYKKYKLENNKVEKIA